MAAREIWQLNEEAATLFHLWILSYKIHCPTFVSEGKQNS